MLDHRTCMFSNVLENAQCFPSITEAVCAPNTVQQLIVGVASSQSLASITQGAIRLSLGDNFQFPGG